MIKWKVIEEECWTSDFREHYVEVFRKYEGQVTDERSGSGRVKVNASSFARHMGIAKMTFHDWLHRTDTVPPAAPVRINRSNHLIKVTPGQWQRAEAIVRRGGTFADAAKDLGVHESTVRRDVKVREAKAAANPGFDPHGSTVHYDRTVACDLEPPMELMNDVRRQLARLLSPVYTLSKFDKARLVAILEDGLNALEEYDR